MAEKSYNKVQLIGRLGQDPELRTIPSGTNVCTLSLATTDRYKDRNGEWQERTDWHRITIWARLGEVAAEYLKKGSRVFIEGRIQYRQYEDRDGVTKYATDIVASDMMMLDSRGAGGGQQGGYSQASPQDDYSQNSPSDHLGPDNADEEDDEVPF